MSQATARPPATADGSAHTSKPHPPSSNGVITDSAVPKGTAVNRKKQKRRQKQAAKQAAAVTTQDEHVSSLDYGVDDADYANGQPYPVAPEQHPGEKGMGYEDPYTAMTDDQIVYSDEDDPYQYNPHYPTGGPLPPADAGKRRKSKKKARAKSSLAESEYAMQMAAAAAAAAAASGYRHPPPPPPPPPPISNDALNTVRHNLNNKDGIWNTSSQEERVRIKEFWLDLPEEERKSLVRIEKEAVLRKMKEQQKHSCSCTVCGRKRTAIEEELEVLYDAYYEELEQFANHNQQALENGTAPPPHPNSRLRHSLVDPTRAARGRIHELDDDEDEEDEPFSDEELDDEVYEDDDYEDDEDGYSGESTDDMSVPAAATDFFTFGNSLTVKGGILTVADDLLKNDGQKFIDMMEQLAERRMQREEDAQHGTYRMGHSSMGPPPPHSGQSYSPQDQEEPYDDDGEYSDEEEDDLDVDDEEMDTMTESQRMEEGRRMFQIFAARMFEQRVLTAYREKVALERQQRLIEELDAEKDQKTLKDEKKQRDAEKKKAKKLQQKQEQARKKALKEEQKAAEEAAAREAEEKRQEELRKKREEQKRKKEEQRKAQEEEKLRKEAEKQRRQTQERERQKEVERKAREEKKRKDDARKKDREEREAKEKAAKDKKTQEELVRREKDEQIVLPADRPHKDETADPVTVDAAKRQPALVALPPGLRNQRSGTGLPSPQTKVATPALPGLAATAAASSRPPRDGSVSTSQTSAPQTPEIGPTLSKQSTPPKTTSAPRSQAPSTPASRSSSQTYQHPPQPPISSPGLSMPLPGGLGHAGFPGMHMGSNTAQQPAGAFMQQIPGRVHPQSIQMPHRQHSLPHPPGPSGAPGLVPLAGPFSPQPPPGFAPPLGSPMSGSSQGSFAPPREAIGPQHVRQQSGSHEAAPVEHVTAANPIGRPAPIKRPTSVKPHDSLDGDLDESRLHLGSSALLDDSDEPLPTNPVDNRRPSAAPGFPGFLGSPFEQAAPTFAPNMRQASSTYWGAPPPVYPPQGFGQTSAWGNAPGWGSSTAAGIAPHRPSVSRPVIVRQLACQASRQLSAQRPSAFHDIGEIMRLVEMGKPPHEHSIHLKEVHDIIDTEGDAHNGGGFFQTARDGQGRLLVKWQSSQAAARASPGGPGEIGSPVTTPLYAPLGRGGF